ncbi:MAG: class II fumarate hydratase [Candidatus Dasytiphilus stammeri]
MIHYRCEKDSLGTINVPASKLWGAQTQRALKYFSISREIMPYELIKALAIIKKATAEVNRDLDLLSPHCAQAIIMAADEVLANKHQNEFPLVIWQTGSGTQSNMNMNEVLANRASEILGGERGLKCLVHPNDDVNKNQSSNDVFPTAMHIAAYIALRNHLIPQVKLLHQSLNDKSEKNKNIIKIGRTHLQDATPITLGQEISGWKEMINNHQKFLENILLPLSKLALGGSAVGTGINTHCEYAERVARKISQLTKQPFITAENKFEALATCDAVVHAHGVLKGIAVSLMKIANDIRLLSSGPRCGIGEILIPENEPGSSIMPGKINPTQCEAITMLCCQVMGNDVSLSIGGSSGQLELNVYRPMIIYNFLQSVRLLSDGIASFNINCITGIKPNLKKINLLLNESLMLVTALTPYIGYDKAAEIATKAHRENLTLKESAVQLGYVTAVDFDSLIRPEKMVYSTII